MTKDDMIRAVYKDTGVIQAITSTVIDSVLDNIGRALAHGEKVQFTGFGTFEPKKRAARIGRNPHTREAVPIPARIIPSFKPGKRLMENVCRDITNEKGGDL